MEKFDSVWEALGFSPEESASLSVRSSLMREIRRIIEKNGWTQAEAAKQCHVSQPRINDLLRGKFHKFSIDALVNMAGALGCNVDVRLRAA
jgi:predicted XRE-type DNA-binding protein